MLDESRDEAERQQHHTQQTDCTNEKDKNEKIFLNPHIFLASDFSSQQSFHFTLKSAKGMIKLSVIRSISSSLLSCCASSVSYRLSDFDRCPTQSSSSSPSTKIDIDPFAFIPHKSCVAVGRELNKWDFESVPATEKDLFGNDKSMQGRMERTMNDNHILFNLILYMWNVNSDEPRKEPVRTFSLTPLLVWEMKKRRRCEMKKAYERSLNHFSRAILHSHFRITFRHFFPFFFRF